ncbi:MacS family sensor histidine kinase [Nocardioides sp.]|uniref:MacS family sensor histidine kinase n=1 Tax=Nocardioides sp. TaxID=35761 RepID=UPI002EDB58E8
MSSRPSPAAVAVEDRLFGALAVLRVVLLANTVGLSVYRADSFERPVLGTGCVAAMAAWTAAAIWLCGDARRRTPLVLLADLALALGMLLLTPAVKGAEFTASLPGFWIVGALLAWSVHYHWLGGLGAGALLAVADLTQRQHVTQSDYGNAFLLVIAGATVGYLADSLRRMATEREAAERSAAMAAERARLARAVHDGVLQVLALVQRRGRELGGEAAGLGELAGEQERELRRLIRAQDDLAPIAAGTLDLVAGLSALEGEYAVTVSTPGTPVEVPAGVGRELVAAVRACLDNVRTHVGEQAPAWVLLQAFPDRVEVSVRDDGPGIAPGRLEEAAAQGRLGVAESVRGRLADLGGSAVLTTGASGTEWELTVPLGSRP